MKREAQSLEAHAAEALARYEELRARGDEKPGEELLAHAVQELGVSLEELRVANEANEQYCTALAAAHEALAAERTAFQMLFEYAPDGYVVTDPVGVVLKANQMAAELFGVPRGAHLSGKPIAVFVPLGERMAFRALLRRIVKGDGRLFTFETKFEARGGRLFDASMHVVTGADELRWTIRDVSEQRRNQRSLVDANESMRRGEERYRMLSAHLHEGIEEERTRIAREVHDELGSALTAIRFELSGLHNAAQASEEIPRAIARIDAAIRTTRRICSDLRPSLLDHMGLWAAIEWFVEDMGVRSGIHCNVQLEPSDELEEPVRTNVFRIVQEAVTNTVRHAGASSLRVSAREEAGHLQIEVHDDGRGIGRAELLRPDAFGITGMQERARACGAQILIEPAARGTRVRLRVPLGREALCES